jgi:hypothetical protein
LAQLLQRHPLLSRNLQLRRRDKVLGGLPV